jgi:predicted ferric reductase
MSGGCIVSKIKWFLGLFLAGLSGLWLLSDSLWPQPMGYFPFRSVFVQFTGVLAIGVMGLAMLLALRPGWLERPLGGLDKMYRLHKWLGITALVVSVLHWWWAKGTKWMVGWGWLARPARKGGGGDGAGLSTLAQWLHDQRGLAETLGEWAFYAMVVLLAVALIQRIPYRWFKKTHTVLAAIFLVLAYHSVVLMKGAYWSAPVGLVTGVLIAIGCGAAVWVLAGRVGRARQVRGTIRALTRYPGVRVVEGCIELEPGWPGHVPGQFAFVTTSAAEGAHPYTIASAWQPETRQLTFIVKELGDWTGQLHDWLKVGMPATVEGPYGCFDFTDTPPRQIWVGAGIGVTPFIARMKYLAQHPGTAPVDFFHVTSEVDTSALEKLAADAEAAGVRLHLIVSGRDGRLTPEQLREQVPEWRSASVWFCGPTAFGNAIRDDLVRHGLAARHYHQELFAMR